MEDKLECSGGVEWCSHIHKSLTQIVPHTYVPTLPGCSCSSIRPWHNVHSCCSSLSHISSHYLYPPSTLSGAQVYSEEPLLQKWMNIMNLIYSAQLTLCFILQKQILILVSWFYTNLWSAGCWFGSLACSLPIANPCQVLRL